MSSFTRWFREVIATLADPSGARRVAKDIRQRGPSRVIDLRPTEGPTPGFAERAMNTTLYPVETPLLNRMRQRCESRGPAGHRCVLLGGHLGNHQASERAGRHW